MDRRPARPSYASAYARHDDGGMVGLRLRVFAGVHRFVSSAPTIDAVPGLRQSPRMLDSSVKTQIMNEVDRQFDDQTKVLADLVKIPSTRFKEAPAQDMMARLFKEDRLSIDRWQIKIDALKHLPGYSPHSQDYDDAWNVVGAWRPTNPKGRSLILNGHIDVVPEGPHEMWARHPYDAYVKDGWMYGRGSGDMKEGVPSTRPVRVRLPSPMRAMPKSMSLRLPLTRSSMTLAGLMSRCTTPRSWA